MTFIGGMLPEEIFLRPKGLDVSKDCEYAVGSFELCDTHYFDQVRGRVLPADIQNEGLGAKLSVVLTSARCKVRPDRRRFDLISCGGRVIDAEEAMFVGASATIDFAEHTRNAAGELPETAFFGDFGCHLRAPVGPHLHLDLRYLPEQAENLLNPLLNQESGTEVIVNAELTKTGTELAAATEEYIKGNVRNWGFELLRGIIDYEKFRMPLAEARKSALERWQEEDDRRLLLKFAAERSNNPKPGDPDYLEWANREGKYAVKAEEVASAMKGIPAEAFERIRKRLLRGIMSEQEARALSFLSWEQFDILERDLER